MPDLILPLDAFVRSVGVTRGTPHAMFLGAGASISSGMPSGQMCIWEWKRDIFLTNNLGLENQFTELSLSSVRQRIQRWLDRQGLYPPEGDPDEYSVYAETCFPIPERRRAYFQEKTRHAKPHTGYQLHGLLAEAGIISSVWTTNFDGLVSRAAAAFKLVPVEVGIDSQVRSVRASSTAELLIVSLHGDYRYDKLKNTAAELQSQEEQLEGALVNMLQDTPVIVCGYSGRDQSVMRAFSAAFSRNGVGTLYWCAQDPYTVPAAVKDLITLARTNSRTAFLVPIQSFDDLMARLTMHCLGDEARKQAATIVASQANVADLRRVPIHVDRGLGTSVIKSNAFEIECPSEVLSFELERWPAKGVWQWVRDQIVGKQVVAVPFKGQILALGTIDDVRLCFSGNIKGKIGRSPIAECEFRYEDGTIVHLMKDALVRTLAEENGLRTDGRGDIWLPDIMKRGTQAGVNYCVHDSVTLFLRYIDGRQFLVMKPSVKILTSGGEHVDRTIANPIKLAILGYQHNKEFNDAVNAWRTRLLNADTPKKTYEFPPACGSTFRFLIRRSPVFAEVVGSGRPPVDIAPRFRPLIKQYGIEIREPELLFSNRSGTGMVKDVHPVRGIITNRPYDFPLTMQGFGSTIRIGIVCPKPEARLLQSFLQNSERRMEPSRHEADYLMAFPGFTNAFGVGVEFPQSGEPGWVTLAEPNEASDDHSRSIEIGRGITRAIDVLQASYTPTLVLILFPERWARYRGFENDTDHFNVHDFVKANGVQRGIGTQFLDQGTLNDKLQCRIWWWLSLAFYVKSLRTPWVLDGLSEDTAFVGLGISRVPGKSSGKGIVLGCSHIYSGRGEGLSYRLSQVEDPIFFGRNPFLSRDDARRVGEQIRELFFDSRERLPSRVVIHKRTHFTTDERLGLREGLSGVREIEMLEIFVDDALRYMASAVDDQGRLYEDNYPVRRGTSLKLDDYSALVWVHGATSAINTGRRYYQGKRRIPAPLFIRRHAGSSDLRTLADEIVGLSKMNWNTFDLYTKLPATVQSSNEIARVGSLLERFGTRSYDFRLFI